MKRSKIASRGISGSLRNQWLSFSITNTFPAWFGYSWRSPRRDPLPTSGTEKGKPLHWLILHGVLRPNQNWARAIALYSEGGPLLAWFADQAAIEPKHWRIVRRFLLEPPVTRSPTTDLAMVFCACAWIARTGMAWKKLPPIFPPPSTVHYWWMRWSEMDEFGHSKWDYAMWTLAKKLRKLSRKSGFPSSLRLDSQSIKASASARESGFDPAKKIKGIKRTIVVDCWGLPWSVRVDPGDHQERAAAYHALCKLPFSTERVLHLVVDGGYAGISFEEAVDGICPDVEIETPRRPKGEFVLAKRRWVVERTFAWLAGFRRLDVNRERTCRSAREMLVFCLVLFMLANVG